MRSPTSSTVRRIGVRFLGVDLPNPPDFPPPRGVLPDVVHPEVHLCLDVARPQEVIGAENRDSGTVCPFQSLLIVRGPPVAALGRLVREERDPVALGGHQVHVTALPSRSPTRPTPTPGRCSQCPPPRAGARSRHEGAPVRTGPGAVRSRSSAPPTSPSGCDRNAR